MKKSIFLSFIILFISVFLTHAEESSRPFMIHTQQPDITNASSLQISQSGDNGISNGIDNDPILYEYLAPASSSQTAEPQAIVIVMSLLIIVLIIVLLLVTLFNIAIFIRILKHYKNNYQNDKIIEELQYRIDEVQGKEKNEFNRLSDELKQQIESFRASTLVHEQYLNHTINYLFQATYSITNQITDEHIAREILNRLFHDFQIAKLYQTSFDSDDTSKIENIKFAAFAYLQENGAVEDIPHLEYVVQHDPNENNRRRAIEVIALIQSRCRSKE